MYESRHSIASPSYWRPHPPPSIDRKRGDLDLARRRLQWRALAVAEMAMRCTVRAVAFGSPALHSCRLQRVRPRRDGSRNLGGPVPRYAQDGTRAPGRPHGATRWAQRRRDGPVPPADRSILRRRPSLAADLATVQNAVIPNLQPLHTSYVGNQLDRFSSAPTPTNNAGPS
jgi:hypothetical protein